MRRLQDQYDETGMRRSVDAVIVCHVRVWLIPSLSLQSLASLGRTGQRPV